MKKFLATMLSFAMLLGAGLMQVSALGSNEGYPYLFETFETEESLNGFNKPDASRATVSIAKGGANGSGGSLQVHQKNKGFFDVTYACEGLAPVKGQKIHMSAWVKLNSEILDQFNNKNCNVFSFIFHGTGIVTNAGNRTDVTVGEAYSGTGWKQYDITNVLVKDQWVKVEKDIEWEDAMSIGSGASIGSIQLKTVSLRVTGEAGIQALADPDATVLDYQIDDFIFEYPDSDRMGVNTGTAGTYVVNDDYDTSSVTGELDGRSDDCSLGYRQVLSPVVTDDKGTHGKNFADTTFSNVYLKMGHLYKVSGWFRYDGIEGDEGLYGDTAKIRQIIYAGKRDPEDKNSFTSGYPSVYPAVIPKGQWTKVEYYYYYEYQAYDNNNFHVGFRICPEKAEEGTYATDDPAGAGTFGFDKLQVFDLGVIGNGDMEISGDGLKVFKNIGEVTQTFPGWTANNATAEVSTDTASGEGQSMKMTSTGNYGDMKTSATFEQGKLYRISFKAKTEGLEENAEVPISLIFDRYTNKDPGTTEVYKVPNFEYMVGPENFDNAKTEWTISNDWKEFSGWYKVNFPRIEGKEDASIANLVPRRPMLYFRVNKSTNPEGTVLYLDDFKVEEMGNSNLMDDLKNGLDADVADISATGTAVPGSEISLSYTYVPKYSEEENKAATVIKAYSVLPGGEIRNYGTFAPDQAFTVPSCAAGQDITFEIIPISTAGLIGNRATFTVGAATDYIVYDAAAGTVTAGCSGASATILYASYNGGRLTSFAVTDAVFEEGKFEETVPAEFSPGEGDTVKVMMWKDLTNCTPICAYAR